VRLRIPSAFALAVLLAACGGSNASFVPRSAGAAISDGAARVDITVPIEILGSRDTALPPDSNTFTHVSPAARSFTLDYSEFAGVESIARDIGAGITGCRRNAYGVLCRIALRIRNAGTNFEFRTYDQPLRGGRPRGGAHMLNYGQTNALPAAKAGLLFPTGTVVGSATVASVVNDPPSGRATDLRARFVIRDADAYPILGGTYVDTSGFLEPVSIDYVTQPPTYTSFSITVNGKKTGDIAGPSDRYDVKYLGEGVVIAALTLRQSTLQFGSATIAPIPRNVPVTGVPKGIASSSLVVPVPGIEYFLEPSGKIGSLKGAKLTEIALPSGDTPTMLALADYEAPFIQIVFATKQNTLGTVDSQRNVVESTAVPGSPITGIDDSASPAYVQSAGTFGQEYDGNPTEATYQVPGTPRLTSFANTVGYAFADPGNDAVGFMGLIVPFFTYFYEIPMPSGSPAFVAAGPDQSVWVALDRRPGGYIMNAHGVKNSKLVKFASSAPLTSMVLVAPGTYDAEPMAATDTNGDVELFDASGNLLHTIKPAGGAASDITAASDTTLYYICTSCSSGIQELVY
jgi:hypothetical protein